MVSESFYRVHWNGDKQLFFRFLMRKSAPFVMRLRWNPMRNVWSRALNFLIIQLQRKELWEGRPFNPPLLITNGRSCWASEMGEPAIKNSTCLVSIFTRACVFYSFNYHGGKWETTRSQVVIEVFSGTKIPSNRIAFGGTQRIPALLRTRDPLETNQNKLLTRYNQKLCTKTRSKA